ncbi:hypothetical protein IAT38_003772 [Cryptococcus sp. DSM 104549]
MPQDDSAMSSPRRRARRGEARRSTAVTAVTAAEDRRKEGKATETSTVSASNPSSAAAAVSTGTPAAPALAPAPDPSAVPNHLLQPARAALLGLGGASRVSSALRWTGMTKGGFPGQADGGAKVTASPKEAPAAPAPPQPVVSPTQTTTSESARPTPSSTPAPTPITAVAPPPSVLPDLTRVATAAYTASLVSRPPPPTYNGRPGTRPFSLHPPAYTDADIPPPQPYNRAYPHPLTAYASPGVNPHTVRASGYGEMLDKLVKEDVAVAVGEVLHEAGFRDLQSSVYLLFSYEGNGNGNGIPESMWSKFDNASVAKLPFAPGAAQPPAQSTQSHTQPAEPQQHPLPPRFSQASLSPAYPTPSTTASNDGDYFSRLVAASSHSRALLDDPTPRPSPDANPRGWQMRTPRPWERERQVNSAMASGAVSGAAGGMLRGGKFGDEVMGQGVGIGRDVRAWKTEICVAWETTRMCQYGTECQFAHGIEELQLTRRDLLLRGLEPPSPTSTQSQRQVGFLPSLDRTIAHLQCREDTLFPNLQQLQHEANRGALSRHLSQLPQLNMGPPASFRQEPRGMSAPHTRLAMVPEMDDMALLQLYQASYRRQSEVALPVSNPGAPIPPIGMERSTSFARAESVLSGSASTPSLGWNPLDDDDVPIPPYSFTPRVHATHPPDHPGTLRSRPSTLSLSTSSSSRFSGYTTYSDGSPKEGLFTPVDADITITEPTVVGSGFGVGGVGLGVKLDRGASVGTTTLDFSTGRSIWR